MTDARPTQRPTAGQVAELLVCRSLLHDVASSGVENDDPRLSYVVVQIDANTWAEIQRRYPLSVNAEGGRS